MKLFKMKGLLLLETKASLHAASSQDLSSSPRLPDTVSPLYKRLGNNSCCIASVLNASTRLLQYAEQSI